VSELIAGVQWQCAVKRVVVAGTLERPRAAFRNWFSGDAGLFGRQAWRAWGVAP